MTDSRICSIGLALAAMLGLQACDTTNAQVPALAVRSLDRGVLSGNLGDALDPKARKLAAEAEYRALESGQTGLPVSWKLTDRVYGNVVPQQPYSVGSVNCRRYVHTINAKGDVRSATGTACRGEDGIWLPLS